MKISFPNLKEKMTEDEKNVHEILTRCTFEFHWLSFKRKAFNLKKSK